MPRHKKPSGGLAHSEFVERFALLANVSDTRARALVRLFYALIVGGVKVRGSVTIRGLGKFTSRWWIPRGEKAHFMPSNRMLFRPGSALLNEMRLWGHCPGYSMKRIKALMAAREKDAPAPD